MKHSLPEALEKKRRGTINEKTQEHSCNNRHTSERELKQESPWNGQQEQLQSTLVISKSKGLFEYLAISVPRHIRFAELRKNKTNTRYPYLELQNRGKNKSSNHTSLITKILLGRREIRRNCSKEGFPQCFVTCC